MPAAQGAPPSGAGPRDAAPPSVGTATGSQARGGCGSAGRDRSGAARTGEPHRGPAQVPARPAAEDAGRCAGLRRRCDMDPVIFRIVLAVLSATGRHRSHLLRLRLAVRSLRRGGERGPQAPHRPRRRPRAGGRALRAGRLRGVPVDVEQRQRADVRRRPVPASRGRGVLVAAARRRPDPLAAQAVADARRRRGPARPRLLSPPGGATRSSRTARTWAAPAIWGPPDARDRDVAAALNIARGTPPAGRSGRPRGP